MSVYKAKITWQKQDNEAFTDKRYSRGHKWIFDGGIEVPASSSPHAVPLPMSVESAVDPEEAFVASISSCHMLTFLFIAAQKKFIIDSYTDNAEGILAKNDEGKLAVTEVTLRPDITFIGENIPSHEQIEELHHLAHEECIIAASVKTKINVIY